MEAAGEGAGVGGAIGRAAAGAFVGDVTALELVRGPSGRAVVFAGAGGVLRVLAGAPAGGSAALLLEQRVLHPGTRVHGIRACPLGGNSSGAAAWSLLIFGEREVCQATLLLEPQPSLQMSAPLGPFHTWVLDAVLIGVPSESANSEDGSTPVVTGCDDNSVLFWLSGACAARVLCSERCLLYSMSLLPLGEADCAFTVAAGTIFHDVLLWNTGPLTPKGPDSGDSGFSGGACPPLVRLQGHQGSIYRVLWVEDGLGQRGRRLVTASDDRTGRVWERRDSESPCESVGDWDCRCSAFGHTARVWDCAQLSAGERGFQALVTASEDCSCRVWTLEGQELCCLTGHVGRGIWRVAAGLGFVVSAGADAAVKLWDVQDWVPALAGPGCASHLGYVLSADRPPETQDSPLPAISRDIRTCRVKPKKAQDWVCCIEAGTGNRLYLATHKGLVYCVSSVGPGEPEVWETVHRSLRGAPFSCIRLFQEDHVGMLLGDLLGYATMVMHRASGWEVVEWEAHDGRAVLGAFGCIGQDRPVTTDRAGEIKYWQMKDGMKCVKFGSSPYGKMVMCMDFCASSGLLVCGDKKGNIFAFNMNEHGEEGIPMSAIVSVEKSHLPHSVTMLRTVQNQIVSGGRDGCIFEHSEIVSEDGGSRTLRPISRKKMQAMTSIHYRFDTGGVTLLGGFQGGDFVLWNDTEGCTVLRVACGGFNRPHALCVSGLSDFVFSSSKYNELVIHRYRNKRGIPACQTLTQSYHGKEIHSVCMLPLMDDGFPIGAFTCSEDGSVKCLRVEDSKARYTIHNFSGERIAGAAMRTVSAHQISIGNWFLVSAGAQEILNTWRVTMNAEDIMSVEWVGAKIPHKDKWRCRHKETSETKHRYLSVRSTSILKAGKVVSFLIVSSSDTSLQVLAFLIQNDLPSWELAANLCFHKSPVLSMALKEMGGRTLVASGATDGSIAIWDISSVVQDFEPGAESLQLRPLLEVSNVHQSGVNALHLCGPAPGAQMPGQNGVQFSVISGGDDQAIHVTVCYMKTLADGKSRSHSLAGVIEVFSEKRAHGSAVKGVWMEEDMLLSGGRDQRVRLWRLSDSGLTLQDETIVDVGNMEAMDVISDPGIIPEDSVRERQYHLIACGRGMQVLSFHRSFY